MIRFHLLFFSYLEYLDLIFMLPQQYNFSNATFEILLWGKGTSLAEDNISISVMNNSTHYFSHQYEFLYRAD